STPGESKDDVSLLNEDVKKEQGSCPVKELTDEAKEDKDEQEEELSLWMSQVQTFFTTKLFPAFQHEMELREEVKSKKEQDAELAVLRKMEAEELARRIAEKEEEEVRRREAAAALKALASQSVTPKGKQRRKEGSAKKDPSRKGLSAKKGDLPKKEAPKQEPSAKKESQKAAKP
ncbi:RS10B protein, partial [Malurus elegans]|nr:RS10B protein [Malurus elegans]